MASYNRVIITGNLTRDPELKFAQSGTAIAELSVAVNSRSKNQGGEWVDEVSFFDVTFFGRTAEVCGEYCQKGSNVLVEGKLKQDRWEKDGQKHSKIKIIGDQMQMLGSKGAKADAPTRETAAPAPSRAANARPAHESVPSDEIPF